MVEDVTGSPVGSTLEVRALGRLDIRSDGQRIVTHLPDKALVVLVYLADAGRPVSRSEVAGLLWSDLSEERARANLRLALTKTRRVLPDIIGADRRSLWLTGHLLYDVSLVEGGGIEETLEWYGGEFLADIDLARADLFDDWVRARRHSLRSTALRGLAVASESAAANGESVRVIELAGRVLEIEPWNEAAHRQLMVALDTTSGRSAALAQFDHCERILLEELGLGPEPETVALADRINAGRNVVLSLGRGDIPGLPLTLTPFFGRDDEVALLVDRLSSDDYRLVTLVGPGGVGKTRLSIAAAERVRGDRELAVFASLAGVRSAAEALSVINSLVNAGRATAVQPFDGIVSVLGSRRCLLVLDNLEHLVDEIVDDVVRVLQGCPNTTVLVTSRQPLGIAAEDVVEVRGLPVPALDDHTTTEAVRLFVDRAYRVDKSFSLNEDNAGDVARLCRLVEGMPLHLELAASRIRHLSVQGILEALEGNAGLPPVAQRDVPERHASFAAVFSQSWALLTESEQRAFTQLTVCRGSFDRHAARELTNDPVAASSVARRSLLFEDGGGRYRFHELIRQAAAALLNDDERIDAEIVHARHYLALLATAAHGLAAWDAGPVADALTPDVDNFRVAWIRAIDHGLTAELGRSADGLASVFDVAGLMIEAADLLSDVAEALANGRLQPIGDIDEAMFLQRRAEQRCTLVSDMSVDDTCQRVLALLEGRPDRAADRARTLCYRARSSIMRHDVSAANTYLDAAEREAETAGDERVGAHVMALRGRVRFYAGRFDEATAELGRALAVFERLDDPAGQGEVHRLLAPAYAEQYQIWKALESDRRALALAETLGHRQRLAFMNANVAASLILFGDYDSARTFTETAMDISRRTGDLLLEGYLLVQLAECLVGMGEPDAETSMSQGIALGRENNDTSGLWYNLVPWSRLLLQLGRLDQAKLVADELDGIAASREADHFVITARLIAARIDHAAGRTAPAIEVALACWGLMHADPAPRLPWPIEARLDVIAVLGESHEIGARALDEAREIHSNTARTIDDPELRRMFMEVLPASRTLAQLVRGVTF